jgi:hypothetical protein
VHQFLAAYDPAHPSPNGNYWVWHHPVLPAKALESYYYDVAVPCLPENPNDLGATDMCGGCAALDEVWCAWFRFFNGGRDLQGRPGRFVILCAFVRREDMVGWDCSGILESEQFQNMARSIPPCPVPKPDALEIDFVPKVVVVEPLLLASAKLGTKVNLEGDSAITQAGELCSFLARKEQFLCKISRREGITRAIIQVTPVSAPAPVLVQTSGTTDNASVDAAENSHPKSRQVRTLIIASSLILFAAIAGIWLVSTLRSPRNIIRSQPPTIPVHTTPDTIKHQEAIGGSAKPPDNPKPK